MAGGQTAARARASGVALALLSALCFGGSGAFGKALIQAGLDPLETVWLRIGGAVVVLLPVVVLVGGAARLRAARAHVPALIAHGVTGIAGCQVLYYLAASRLPVGVAILLEFTGPVLVLAWIRFGRRAPVHRSAVAGVAVAVAAAGGS
jgi:threonine/homoserine efflux transporter RhtA